ncbi:MAG TPA: arginine decarboxylase, pyruvoyl-dependent [Syntrophomonadaceae bacterium]|nr:arginine decarboxylase, pyruvoyl-dependent [Syntrophomonadaceae bacterium]
MMRTPELYTMVAAAAEGKKELTAFDQALLKAGVGNVNLITVSSILPPGAEFVEKLEFPPGSLLPIAYGSITSSEPGSLIAAAVAVGIGPEKNEFGVIMEFSGYCTRQEAENEVKQMVTEAFQYRGRELIEIKVAGVEHRVVCCGSVFAGIPLWYK